jgi:hypothetical protein
MFLNVIRKFDLHSITKKKLLQKMQEPVLSRYDRLFVLWYLNSAQNTFN